MPPILAEPDEHGVEGIGDVVLAKLARAPAGDVEIAVVQRQVDVRHQRRHRLEPLEQGRQIGRIGRLRGDRDHLLRLPLLVRGVQVPDPDRRRQVLQRDHHAGEPVGLARITGGPELEHHLVLRAELDGLEVPPPAQVPDVQRVAVLAAQEQLGVHAVLHHVRRAPLAADHHVLTQVPGEVVGQVLRPALTLPAPADLERLVIQREQSPGPSPPVEPSALRKMPSGPQCTVCGAT